MEYYWKKIDGKVYHIWRLPQKSKKWTYDLTPYTDLPYVVMKDLPGFDETI